MCFVYGGEYKETELKKRTLWKYGEDVEHWGGWSWKLGFEH
jgi:hypothetical protein